MQQSKAILLTGLLSAVFFIATAQQGDTTAIDLQVQNNKAKFSSTLRPLRQVAGAPEAFYTYFWEFGDGSFSFRENPTHIFKDTGIFNTRLYATNNYDDGKPPPLKTKPVKIKTSTYAANENSMFFKKGGSIEMKVNRMPKPNEDMVLIMGYRNENKNIPMDGSVILFYNEKQFRNNNFDITEERTYNNEKITSLKSVTAFSEKIKQLSPAWNVASADISMLQGEGGYADSKSSELIASRQKYFKANKAWHFSNLKQGAEKYFFISLHTAAEMIRDTNAVVTLTGMFVPDDPNGDIEEFNLELQIVASHDPNRMMLKKQHLNYRFTGTKRENEYTVRFQNTGAGPSRQVTIGVGVPQMMDAQTLEVLDIYPKCIMCRLARAGESCFDTLIRKDSIYFIFNNIYLPGLREAGMTDPDSTWGFVRYRMHFSRQLKKLPFESSASILFDKNKPVRTNIAKGDFKPGRSPGIIVGYNRIVGENSRYFKDDNYFSAGVSISQYSPYRKYLQAELLAGIRSFPEQLVNHLQNKDTTINNEQWLIICRDTYQKHKVIKLHLVPLQLRYNFSNIIAGGVGTQICLDAITQTSSRQDMQLRKQGAISPTVITSTQMQKKWFRGFDAALFADIQVGKVRAGPVAGIRYLHYFRFPQNVLFLYAGWRL